LSTAIGIYCLERVGEHVLFLGGESRSAIQETTSFRVEKRGAKGLTDRDRPLLPYPRLRVP
jgi:hypothetical protein